MFLRNMAAGEKFALETNLRVMGRAASPDRSGADRARRSTSASRLLEEPRSRLSATMCSQTGFRQL